MIRIRLFGGLSVSRDDQKQLAPSATQPRRLAILAIIAFAGERGVSRDRLHSLFWPDAEEELARRGLTQALYALRTGLDAEHLFHGVQELRLNREVASCDVLEYAEAIDGGEPERAATLYTGPFLDGFRVPGLPDFDRRVEEHRDELARRHETLIERLAVRATKQGETERAVEWWRQRAAMDPFSARVAEAYMRALAAAGDRIGAMRHARVHEQLVGQEFGTDASTAVTAYAEQLRTEQEAPSTPKSAPAPTAAISAQAPTPEPVAPAPTPVPVALAAVALAAVAPAAVAPAPVAPPTVAPPTVAPPTVAPPTVAPALIESAPAAPTVSPEPLSARDTRPRTSRLRSVVLVSGVAISVLAALLLAANLRRGTPLRLDDVDLRALRVSAPQRIAADDVFELDPAISPDGQQIAYVAGEDGALHVYVRHRDGGQAVPVAESVGGDQRRPRWSPNGSQIVFQAASGIWIVPALGGAARLAVEPPADVSAAAAVSPVWSPRGTELAWALGDTIYIMPVNGGARRVAAVVPSAHSLAWSPDGQWIATTSGNPAFSGAVFAKSSFGNLAPSAIVLAPVANAATSSGSGGLQSARVLVPPTTLNTSPAWLDQHTLAFVSSRNGTRDIFVARITDAGVLRGNVERLTAGVDAHSVSASADGRQLAYAVFRQLSNVWSLPLRPDTPAVLTAATRVTQGTQIVEGLDVSLDGRWLVYDADNAGQQDIFRLPLRDGAPASRDPERIVSSPTDDFHPAWSPDGQWIAFYSIIDNVRRSAYVRAVGGRVRLVHPDGPPLEEHSPIWSADGKSLVFFRGGPQHVDLYRADRTSDTSWAAAQRITTRTGLLPSFSADGSQMAYLSRPGIVRMADGLFREAASRIVLSPPKIDGVTTINARITPNGKALIVKGYDRVSNGFWWYPLTNGVAGTPRLLVRFDDRVRTSPRIEFASDGRHLFFALAERSADVWAMQLDKR